MVPAHFARFDPAREQPDRVTDAPVSAAGQPNAASQASASRAAGSATIKRCIQPHERLGIGWESNAEPVGTAAKAASDRPAGQPLEEAVGVRNLDETEQRAVATRIIAVPREDGV